MSDDTPTNNRDTCSALAAPLELSVAYEPDDERQVRALLLIAGLPAEEIERLVADMALESDREM